jgi:peptidoglycan hydrolase-like protein with peptidoglycan-binding domain
MAYANPFAGLPLDYLIGKDGGTIGQAGRVAVVGYDVDAPPSLGSSIGYCNLRREDGEPDEFGPYLPHDDLWNEYPEGRPDPAGPGFVKNIHSQCDRRRRLFPAVEFDNWDSYRIEDVTRMLEIVEGYGLLTIAKNPGLLSGSVQAVAHPTVVGIIVERGAGTAGEMDELCKAAGKPELPVWFVAFGDGLAWARSVAAVITSKDYRNMSVTYSSQGEYGSSTDILMPKKLPSVFINPTPKNPSESWVDGVPPWLANIRADLGLEEFAGSANNPKIIAKTIAIADRFPNVPGFRQYSLLYKDDSDQAWCGLEAADAVSADGHMPPFGAEDIERYLWARSWAKFGVALSSPRVGAILVFDRHVAFLNRIIDANTYEVIGGNQGSPQGGAVTLSRRKASEVVAMRWPAGAPVGIDPVLGPPPPEGFRPLLRYGWVGPEVAELQTLLGGIEIDGEFGEETEAAVRAFQASRGLEVDGEVGSETWGALLSGKPSAPSKPNHLAADVIARISALVSASELSRYSWNDRGVAPIGYLKGMAVTFAYVYAKWKAGDSSAQVMSALPTGDTDHDALAWYGFTKITVGASTLRALFVLMIGLGMRESSGRYCEGRDESASNTIADTAEAGLFQQSWNSHVASSEIEKLFAAYSAKPDGFLSIFREGVTPRPGDLDNFGSGDGARFQELCKTAPAFAVECAAVGLRTIRKHWGPINRREVEIVPAADVLLQQVQAIVDAIPTEKPMPDPSAPTLDLAALEARVIALTNELALITQHIQQVVAAAQQLRAAVGGSVTPPIAPVLPPVLTPVTPPKTDTTGLGTGIVLTVGSLISSLLGFSGPPVGAGATTAGALLPLLGGGLAALGASGKIGGAVQIGLAIWDMIKKFRAARQQASAS